MPEFSTPKERVEYGLETIALDRTVTVSLRDLMYLHQAFGELVRFFHQPLHYPTLEAVERFLGPRNTGGAIDVLFESYYDRIREMIPPDIDEAFGDGGRFEHPLLPAYFQESDSPPS